MDPKLGEPSHPAWAFLNLVVVLGFILLFAYMNATNFDHTEIRMIIEFIAAIGGWEFLKNKLRQPTPDPTWREANEN